MTGGKPCLRCLLREIPEGAALMASLRELIGQIPAEDRTPPETRESRLNACKSCPRLNRGTCSLCGCYVEHRAERKSAVCPEIPPRWEQADRTMKENGPEKAIS